MADCDACIAMNGKLANHEPHGGLSSVHTAVRTDGDLVTYSCRQCRAQWRRLETNLTFRGAPQYWHRL